MPESILLPNGARVVGKPFPRVCAKCGAKAVIPATIPYRATIAYDDRSHSVDIPELIVPRCGACGELQFDTYADDQINQAFRVQIHLLTPQQIRANREALGLSSADLAARLGVADDLVRRWEEDLLIQSRVEDNLLRLYFGLPQVRLLLTESSTQPEFGAVVGY